MKKVTIYTDGSCSGNPGPGGFAAILISGTTEKEICGGEKETTNNRMELRAPIEALRALKEPCEVDMFCDSAYVVNCFDKGWIYGWQKAGWKKKTGELKNIDLLKELYKLCNTHTVTWNKVKGHADNEYNNRCDKLAVEQTEKYKNGAADETPVKEEPKVEFNRDTEYEGPLFEKVEECETVFKGKIMEVKKMKVSLPDGRTSGREVVKHNGGAAIVAIDDNDEVFMVRQYRIAVEKELIEIPAGKIEDGEDPAVCAERELREETGYSAGQMRLLTTLYATPGYCSERLYVYLATNLTAGHPHRDEAEFLRVRKYKLKDLLEMVYEGQISDAKTVAGILLAERYYK